MKGVSAELETRIAGKLDRCVVLNCAGCGKALTAVQRPASVVVAAGGIRQKYSSVSEFHPTFRRFLAVDRSDLALLCLALTDSAAMLRTASSSSSCMSLLSANAAHSARTCTREVFQKSRMAAGPSSARPYSNRGMRSLHRSSMQVSGDAFNLLRAEKSSIALQARSRWQHRTFSSSSSASEHYSNLKYDMLIAFLSVFTRRQRPSRTRNRVSEHRALQLSR